MASCGVAGFFFRWARNWPIMRKWVFTIRGYYNWISPPSNNLQFSSCFRISFALHFFAKTSVSPERVNLQFGKIQIRYRGISMIFSRSAEVYQALWLNINSFFLPLVHFQGQPALIKEKPKKQQLRPFICSKLNVFNQILSQLYRKLVNNGKNRRKQDADSAKIKFDVMSYGGHHDKAPRSQLPSRLFVVTYLISIIHCALIIRLLHSLASGNVAGGSVLEVHSRGKQEIVITAGRIKHCKYFD